MFEVETVRRNDRGQFPEPDGDIVHVFDPVGPGIEKLRFLVKAEEVSLTYTCHGKDGECSREVDGPDEYCWQHEADD